MPQAAFGTGQPRVTVAIPSIIDARNLPHVSFHLPPGLHEAIAIRSGIVMLGFNLNKANENIDFLGHQPRGEAA